MTDLSKFSLFFAASLALHAGASVLPGVVSTSNANDVVWVSYSEAAPAERSASFSRASRATAPKREASPKKVSPKAEFQKSLNTLPATTAQKTSVAMSSAARSRGIDPSLIRQSSSILADPRKKQVFTEYFGQIKDRIQNTVFKNYSAEATGKGNISMIFVLSSDGRLEQIMVKEGESNANFLAKEFAVNCVREAGPFGSFPKELNFQKLSFNLSLLLG